MQFSPVLAGNLHGHVRGLCLPPLSTLAIAVLQAAEFQEETVVKRKELAQSTRAFKAKVSVDVAKAVGPLLKDYQGEVDRLTRR